MKFNQRLKELRLSKGLSQKELAEKLNIGRTTVCEYERGKIVPKQEGLLEIANFFNVSTDYLTGVSNDPITPKHNMSDLSDLLITIHQIILDKDNAKVLYEEKELSSKQKLYIGQLIQQLKDNIDMLIQMDENFIDTKSTPNDYDRWGKTCVKVTGEIRYSEPADYFPKELRNKFITDENEQKSRAELVLQKQRNGEELTDDELDILFEQMSTETAEAMSGTHPPKEKNKKLF